MTEKKSCRAIRSAKFNNVLETRSRLALRNQFNLDGERATFAIVFRTTGKRIRGEYHPTEMPLGVFERRVKLQAAPWDEVGVVFRPKVERPQPNKK